LKTYKAIAVITELVGIKSLKEIPLSSIRGRRKPIYKIPIKTKRGIKKDIWVLTHFKRSSLLGINFIFCL
jgi:hypothetical protein